MTTPAHADPRLDVPALVIGATGLGLLAVGSLWPWFAASGGIDEVFGTLPSPVLLWVTVLTAGVALVLGLAGRRIGWAWGAVGLMLVIAVAAASTGDPGWMCWDGVDAEGNMVGGCEEDEWTPMPLVFAAGLALVTVAILRAVLAARRR